MSGETEPPLRGAFDRRLKLELEFRGARITSDGGLLTRRELDDAPGVIALAASGRTEGRGRTTERPSVVHAGLDRAPGGPSVGE